MAPFTVKCGNTRIEAFTVSHDFTELYSLYKDQKNTHLIIYQISWLNISRGHVTQLQL